MNQNQLLREALRKVIAAHDENLAYIGEQMRTNGVKSLSLHGPVGVQAFRMLDAIKDARAALAQPVDGGEVVAWFKHGPYEDGEPLSCVFEDPNDDVNYSALVFKDPELRTSPPASQEQAIEITRLKAEIKRLEAIKRVSIPTPAMEQEYQWHWRQGYEAGKKASQEQAQQPQAQAQELPDERAAFEAEMRCEDVWGHRSLARNKSGGYSNWCVDLMWGVWQARAALAAKQERKPVTGPVTHGFGDVRPHVEHDFPDCAVFKNGKCTCFATNKRKF